MPVISVPSSTSVMYAPKIEGAINFEPTSFFVKYASEPMAVIKFVPVNSTVIFLPISVVPTPGVNTWPKPAHARQVLTLTSVKVLVDILNLVGSISFLFWIGTASSSPLGLVIWLIITSFGRIPNKEVSLAVFICFGVKPLLTEYIWDVPSSPPSI